MRHADAGFFAHTAAHGHNIGTTCEHVNACPWSKRDAHLHDDGNIGSQEYGDIDIHSYRHLGEYVHKHIDTGPVQHTRRYKYATSYCHVHQYAETEQYACSVKYAHGNT